MKCNFKTKTQTFYKRKYVHKLLVNRLLKPAQEKVFKWTDRPAMTIAVDMGRKATNTNKQTKQTFYIYT